ncbi:response regulator [Ferrovibrio sp.]|uniref:response regulator n=1 Tax=Ferrovibrio sp. TaxID=1917215 RepID=UPI000CCA7088|nr:response regulator [Ferrovibrio sp.]PJI41085.1 MAG: response regulator [Ferrovibrio sp.]
MARILVAEHEVPVREFIRRVLQQRGHEVVVVDDGAEAVVKLARLPFDLLLADVAMPNMDGVELSLKVARDFPNLPVLMMSNESIQRRRSHDIDSLMVILQKPFTMVALNDAVERALGVNVKVAGPPAD